MKTVVLATLLSIVTAPMLSLVSPVHAQTSQNLAVSYRTITRHEAKKYDIKARYPVFAGTTPVVRLANATARSEAQKMADEFVKRTLSDEKEFGKQGFHGDYAMELKPTVSLARPDIISFSFERYANLGGPHPSTDYATLNFGMRNGAAKRLALGDIFAPGFQPYGGLDKYLIPALRQRKASSITDGMIKTLGKNELKDWCITPTGLTFIFAPYTVASYAEGTFVVKKSYDELRSVLNKQGPLVEMF